MAASRPTTTPPAFERTVTPAAPGPNRLALDIPLLVGASPLEPGTDRGRLQGLGELRLSDRSGREVPYLLVQPTREPEAVWQGVAAGIRATVAGRTEDRSVMSIERARPTPRVPS